MRDDENTARQKIILMSKLAVYDKRTGQEDWKKDGFFRQDYIYKSNMKERVYIFIGCVLVTALYFFHKAAFGNTDIFSLNYTAEAVKIVGFFVATLVAYSFFGTVIYTARYHQSQKRIEKYFEMLDELDRLDSGGDIRRDEEDDDDESFYYHYLRPRKKTAEWFEEQEEQRGAK